MRRLVFTVIGLGGLLLLLIGSSAQDTNVKGDVNGDSVVNILDLTLIASHFGERSEPTQMPNPDVNGDGSVNILDLVLVANIISRSQSGGTLIFGRGGDSITLDSAQILDGESAKVADLIYDTLVQYRGDTTDIEPALAVAWDSSTDGLTWTFHLRQGVQFHDGTPFDAAAAVFSLNRAIALSDNVYLISQVIALDAFTIQITLQTPYAPFISALTQLKFAIVSPTAIEHLGENLGTNPVGTGPFKFLQWDKDDKIVLTANNAHWSGKPALDRLIFRSIPDNAERLMALQQGDLHVMEFPNPDDIPLIQNDSRLELAIQPGLNVGYLAMNMEKPPFDNPKVRLAMNHAINKIEIVEHLYQGLGIPAKGPIPPALWSYDDTIEDYTYNPELARQLLAEAGYPDGFETTLWALPVPRPYIPNGSALAEMLQSDLQNVGITARIVTYDWATYVEKIQNGEHDMAMLGWSAGGDPDDFFYYLLSKTTAQKPALNIAFYRSDEMQDVLERARMSTNQSERIELYQQAQAIFHKDVPWVPLAHAQRLLVVNRSVQNLKLAPVGWKYLRHVSLTPE